MTIEFSRPGEGEGGKLEIVCDGPKCPQAEEFEGEDFFEAMSYAKEAGWKNIPDGKGEYRNVCPVCSASSS